MQHALSKISFKVMKGKEQTVTTEDYVKKVELTSNNAFVTAASPATEVTMQLTDGTLTGTLNFRGTLFCISPIQVIHLIRFPLIIISKSLLSQYNLCHPASVWISRSCQ